MRFGHKQNHRSAAVRGARAGCAPPGSASVTDLPIENVPRELATCFREVLDNGGTMHVEPYGEPAPSSWLWPELLMQLHNKIFASTYDQKLRLLRHTVSKTKAGRASRPMSHK